VDTKSVLFYLALVKTIAAARFKQQCLAILERVDDEGIVITNHGRPVARLTRIPSHENDADLIGSLRGQLAIKGDILSTGVAWDAES
jgi:prevent-host-death family protein